MTSEIIGEKFVKYAGYNEVAELNNIIVLYPQTHPTDLGPDIFFPPWNLHGCYDFWGYTGHDYAFKTGPQMAAIKAMIDRLTQLPHHSHGTGKSHSPDL
jgi:poly(3-hydroxybutyrate) depolymerase